ncbi:MAG TPA: D-2-hydroxyacid dehydrogenase [Alphaproteobacteria bacterium]|nr:D-2-hydroxyacid dehydrogenase [Alphaproteobacteria bacterium]
MAAKRRRGPAAKPNKKSPARRTGRRIHLHVENDTSLGPVFEVSRERVAAALRRHPALKGRVAVSIGYDGDVFERAMRTADVLFGWKFAHVGLAARAPRLRWVHVHGAGVNHLMPLDWLPKGAVLTNSRGVHGAKADEYTIMALLMLNNHLPRIVTNQRARKWQQLYNTAIAGKTLLIVGVGHIGGGAARWARRFGLCVIGIRRSGRPHPHVDEMHRPAALRRLLPKADFVLIAAPHTRESHHLIGARELKLMKDGAGLINYSRAQLVDYGALAPHLKRGRLAAVLDVFDPEPLPPSSPIWSLPNLIVTPHSSSDDLDLYTPKTLDLLFGNMERFIAGKPLVNRVSPRSQY